MQVVTTALIMGVIIKTQALLSPAGARVVTNDGNVIRAESYCCCPPQGHELLHPSSATALCSISLLSPRRGASCYVLVEGIRYLQGRVVVPRRGASCYLALDSYVNSRSRCCPPQGRELLRQKCEKYNADFRHSYNLFVLSSVFLRIHS